jgi:hypothetical protein
MQQRVRQLTLDNRTLEERLTAARSNLRFQDRRVADLEAKLAYPTHIGRRKITPTGDRDEQRPTVRTCKLRITAVQRHDCGPSGR